MDAGRRLGRLVLIMIRRFAIPLVIWMTLMSTVELRAQSSIDELLDMLADEDVEVDADRLLDLMDSPIDLRTATYNDLMQIPMLASKDAYALIEARDRLPDFENFEQLAADAALDNDTEVWIRHFIQVNPPAVAGPAAPSVRGYIRNRLTRRLDLGRGYDKPSETTTYLGGPIRHYQRIRLQAGRVETNVTFDKMPGEKRAWDPASGRLGFAFASAYMRLEKPSSAIRRIVVGDFAVDEGFGLSLGASMFGGKSREPVRGIVRSGNGIREVGSSMRTSYNRGVAAALRLRDDLDVTLFGSRRFRDARVDSVFIDGRLEARARGISGTDLHRTDNELGRRRSLRESFGGFAIRYTRRSVFVGATAHHVVYDPPIRPADRDDLVLISEFGRQTTASVYAHLKGNHVSAFGEVASARNGATATLTGVTYAAGQVESIILYRRYPAHYDNYFARAFGHQSGVSRNETGMYFGIRARLSRSITMRAFLDDVRFPWLRFGRHVPTSLTDTLFDLEYKPRRWWTTTLTMRTRTEGVSFQPPEGNLVHLAGEAKRLSIRLDQRIRTSPEWQFHVRLESMQTDGTQVQPASGHILFQEAIWQPHRAVSASARFMLFDTDDAVRMYVYERDLVGAFGMLSVGGRGRRSYVACSIEPSSRYVLQLKYGATVFFDAQTVGSGIDEVQGNKLRELRLQFQIRI